MSGFPAGTDQFHPADGRKRRLFLLGGLAAILAVAGAGPGRADDGGGEQFGPLGPVVLGAVAGGAATLTVIPAGAVGDDMIWAAWDDRSAASAVHLALLRRTGTGTVTVWSVRHADAYAPALETLPGTGAGSGPVLLLRYHYGAAVVQADLYGIGPDGRPVLRGRLDGALIETSWVGGTTLLRVLPSSDLRGPPACFAWDAARRALGRRRCRDAGRL